MKSLVFFFCLLICLAGCKKSKSDQTVPQSHEFKGIAVINDIGEIMGTWGTDDGDWGNDVTWTPGEFGLLNPDL